MLEAIANQVVNLQRLEIGPLSLGDLELGDWRYLTQKEVNQLLSQYK